MKKIFKLLMNKAFIAGLAVLIQIVLAVYVVLPCGIVIYLYQYCIEDSWNYYGASFDE